MDKAKKVYIEEWLADRKIERLAKYRKYYAENKDKIRAYNNAYNKTDKARIRRAKYLREWRGKNPVRSCAFSMKYYFENQKVCDERHKKWEKKIKEKLGSSSYKRYNGKKYRPVASALARASATKECAGDKKTIRNDIKIIKAEIKRLNEM